MAVTSKQTAVLTESPPSFPCFVDFSAPSLFSYCSSPTSSNTAAFAASRKLFLSRRGENALINNWLDAMRSASPPRVTKRDDKSNFNWCNIDPLYADWLTKHPSALSTFEKLIKSSKTKKVALFLDYDGTLSPIVEDPERAFMSDPMRAAVKEAVRHFPTAIISGRSREKVYDFVQLPELYYAGSHGMDIMGPATCCTALKVNGVLSMDRMGNQMLLFQPASDFAPMINELFDKLEEQTKTIPGATIEHNKFCITIHFRRVAEKSWSILAEKVQTIVKTYPKLVLTHGRKVLEVRPSIEWDKGKAVNYLLHALGLEHPSDYQLVYIGDDRTDEDAFKVLNDKTNGHSILVSSVPKSTSAAYSLRDPAEVMMFLSYLVKWKTGSTS